MCFQVFVRCILLQDGADGDAELGGVFGQLEILVHQAGADDGGFLGLNQGNRHPRMLEQEVFAEKAL